MTRVTTLSGQRILGVIDHVIIDTGIKRVSIIGDDILDIHTVPTQIADLIMGFIIGCFFVSLLWVIL